MQSVYSLSISCGAHRGSVLGPLLFLLILRIYLTLQNFLFSTYLMLTVPVKSLMILNLSILNKELHAVAESGMKSNRLALSILKKGEAINRGTAIIQGNTVIDLEESG